MKPGITDIKNIIISRTDSIGDVILTLPLARILKEQYPQLKVAFMGKSYTKAVIESCVYVDAFIDVRDFLAEKVTIDGARPDCILHVFPVKELAKRAKKLGIPWRIGTTGRLYHWHTCNKLVKLSRKKSELHEAQLNTKLLQPLGIDRNFSLETLGQSFGMERLVHLPAEMAALIDRSKFNLILHPRSQGSAREWGLDNFARLVNLLSPDQYKIFISGTAKERESLDPLFNVVGTKVTDICGRMDLATFMAFIHACDGLVANSTGPLHIAAALGKRAVGIYPPLRPMHPGRWQPLGARATYLVQEQICADCRKRPAACHCMQDIRPEAVMQKLES